MRTLTNETTPVRDRSVTERLLSIDEVEFLQKFHRQPFLIQHDLCQHPLFALPRLLELAKTLPEDQIEYNAGQLPVNQDQSKTPRNGLSVEETIRRIEECQSWMVLKSVEADPDYHALLHACLAQVKPLSDLICPGMMNAQAFIFLTSPNSVTPYHIDPEHNFLLQIRGSKKVSLFDGRDRSLVTEEDLERFYGGKVRNMTLPDSHKDKAWRFHLKEGFGLHFPVTYPHWVQNGPEVSISFSITFRTPDLDRRRTLYTINRLLRARGLTPTPPGVSAWRDTLKYHACRGLRKLGAVLGRDW